MTKPSEERKTGLWAGIIIVCACLSLFEDMLGQERYVAFVRSHWTSGWATVPLALFCLFIGYLLLTKKKDRK